MRPKFKALIACGLVAACFAGGSAQAQGDTFDIQRFQVEGNSLLAPAHVEALVAPFIGHHRSFADVQGALDALERAYRASGYGTVQVRVPEQELTQGVVRLVVTEAVIGNVLLKGNTYFDDANVRASLPSLQEGKAPNMRALSENIELANENPAKHVEVRLGLGAAEGTVDAKLSVVNENPRKFIATLDNTGTGPTGNERIGIAYQDANVANTDQVMTVAYTTSPDAPSGIKVDIFSFAYRIPFYGMGDSADIMYGKSSVNSPISQATGFNLAGKGDVLGLRWNHYFARRGEYSSKLIAGLDYKHIDTRCNIGGIPTPVDPPFGGGAGCTPYTLRPLSLTYTGQKQSPGRLVDYSLGIVHNLSMGNNYTFFTVDGNSGSDRYSMVSSNRSVPNDFSYFKGSASYLYAFANDWTARAAISGQYSGTALPSPEQISIAGASAVRGFTERAVAGDKGFVANLELYTPELSQRLGLSGSFKVLGFYDFGRVFSYGVNRSIPEVAYDNAGIASVGVGLRYSAGKGVSVRFDLARVIDAGPADVAPGTTPDTPVNTEGKGDWRGHFAVQLAF